MSFSITKECHYFKKILEIISILKTVCKYSTKNYFFQKHLWINSWHFALSSLNICVYFLQIRTFSCIVTISSKSGTLKYYYHLIFRSPPSFANCPKMSFGIDPHPGDCGSLFDTPSPWSPFLLPSPKAGRPFSCTSDGTTDSLKCLQFFSIASRTKSKLGSLTARPFSPANLISHTHPPPQRDLLPDMISFFLPLCLYRIPKQLFPSPHFHLADP